MMLFACLPHIIFLHIMILQVVCIGCLDRQKKRVFPLLCCQTISIFSYVFPFHSLEFFSGNEMDDGMELPFLHFIACG